MPYTNTQHPSNTRTTVTIVLAIIFGVSIIPNTALGALYFNLENADAPTLYQEVKIKVREGFNPNPDLKFVFKMTDKFYFMKEAEQCIPNPVCGTEVVTETRDPKHCELNSPPGVTLWRVRQLQDSMTIALATIIIKSAEFKEGQTYKICYLEGNDATEGLYSSVHGASSSVSKTVGEETSVPFTVRSSIYTAPVMNPSTVYAGQGPVTVTITGNSDKDGSNIITQRLFLTPCRNCDGSRANPFSVTDIDTMASLCSKEQDKVTIGKVKGYGTGTLETILFAPVTPVTPEASYGICVSYCFKIDGVEYEECSGSDVSWALVNSNIPIKILPANPSLYITDPKSPYTLTFIGTDLKKGDKIRILKKGKLCPSSSTHRFDGPYNEVTATCTTDDDKSSVSKFTLNTPFDATAIGQVCYSRAGNTDVWAPVIRGPEKTALYFSLENADVPTLYQEVRVKVRRGSAEAAEPKFAAGDEFYFISKTGEEPNQCTITHVDVPVWSVKLDTGGNSAMATVVIKSAEFTVGKTYKMCYIKKDPEDSCDTGGVAHEASYTTSGDNKPVDFTIQNSIYTAHEMTPGTVYAGQGPVTLTITAKPISGTALGNGEINEYPYLIPCENAECSDKDRMASICSKHNNEDVEGAVETGDVKGFGTDKLTMQFYAPLTPADSYRVCVPYCFQTDKCANKLISWALVNSDTPIKILPANPSLYTIDPSSPKTLAFTGSGLTAGDKIRILKTGVKCPSSFATLLKDKYTEVTPSCPTVVATSSVSKFTLNTPFDATAIGQVCYSRAGNTDVWAPVFNTAGQIALYFSLENADVPTLYQEVRVRVRKGSNDDTQFVFKETDKFYFINIADTDARKGTKKCEVSPAGVTFWNVVRENGSKKNFAMVTVTIKSAEFKDGATYKMCYIKKDTGDSCGVVYEATYTSTSEKDTPADFTVASSIYTAPVLEPTTVYAGQGPVTLTITAKPISRTALGNNEIQKYPFLIPCLKPDCSDKEAFTEEDKDRMASLCSKDDNQGAVKIGYVTGYGTGTLTTKFYAPLAPVASYGVCVPYCFKSGKCANEFISWALVNSNTPIKILPANPSSYALSPKFPQARTLSEITFTGTDIKKGDKIRILSQVTKGEFCSSSAATLPDIEYTSVVTATSDTSSVSKFRLRAQLAAAVTGQVCYSRADSPTVWAPVFQSAGQAASGLVISPMQPTGFTVVPATPEIGKELELTFTGTDGLTAQDSSYLVTCAPEVTSPQPSTGILPDSCDDAKTDNQYKCLITKGVQSVKCKAVIDDRATNSGGMRLCVCYKKSGQSNYALVNGNVELRHGNPTYTISPYPFYVGQGAKFKFTGTGLGATDEVKIIAKGGDCNDDGNSLQTVSITAKPVKEGEMYTYTIMGSHTVCFTVCYRRSSVWTISTNTDTRVITSTCPSASAFIRDMTLRYTLSRQIPSKQRRVSVTFSNDSSYSVGSLVIIPLKEECTTRLCWSVLVYVKA